MVLQELAIVVSPQFVDSEERLTAFDAITGEIIWSEDADFYAVPAFRCGIDVCTHNEQKRTQYDALTGKRTTSFRAPHVETIFDSTVRHLFASGPRPTGNTDWVALHDAISGTEIWKADRSAVEEAASVTVSPEYGWSAIIDESNDIVAWYAGTNDPAFAGVWTGFDMNSGEIRWTYASEQSCVFDDFTPDAILVCRTEGDEQSISRLDTATGNSVWSAVTGTSDDYVWTSAVGGFVFAESANGLTVIDLETGNDIQPTDIQLCGFGQPWQSIDVGWWDEPVSYRAASLPALCDMDLAAVSAAEALKLDPALAAAAHISVGNGWSVAVGVNGELSATHTG